MELTTEYCSGIEEDYTSKGFAKASRVLSFGIFLSGIAVLLFLLHNDPHFIHPQNFLEQYISKNYHSAVLNDMIITLLSGAYTLFSTIFFRLSWRVGVFSITIFLLGLAIPLFILQPWYSQITGERLHIDVAIVFVIVGIFFDSLAIATLVQSDDSCGREEFLGIYFSISLVLLIILGIIMNHNSDRAKVQLQQVYKEAMTFPKAVSYSMDWSNVEPSKVREDLRDLGGYGAKMVAKAYQQAGYETSVVVWNNLMQLGRYVNTLQSQGLLSGGIPWQITPSASTLRHLHRLEPYVYFFQHHNIHFYTAHSGVNFFERYRRIQALHRGDFFIRNLASISKVEAVSRWLEPGYRYEISLTLGTGGVSKYYEDHARQYKKWQRCMESEGSSFCSNLKPERGYIPNN